MRTAEYAIYPTDGQPTEVHRIQIDNEYGLTDYSIVTLDDLLSSNGFNMYQGHRPEHITIEFQKGVLRDCWRFWYNVDLMGRLLDLHEDETA